jgi:hypothetical protein
MIYTSKNCGKNCFGNNRIAVSRAERAACDSEAFELRRPFDPSRTCSSNINPIIQKKEPPCVVLEGFESWV